MQFSSIVFALLSCAFANHTNFYQTYSYNISLSPASTERVAQCLRNGGSMSVMRNVYVQNVNITDGSGGVSAALKAECGFIESGIMPQGWTSPSWVSAQFANFAQDIFCPVGYYVNGINIKPQKEGDTTALWSHIVCIKPANLEAEWGASVSVPFRNLSLQTTNRRIISCPPGTFITGFKTMAEDFSNKQPGDLVDIQYMICTYPLPVSCQLTAAREMSLISFDLEPQCEQSMHQFCGVVQKCPLGYFQTVGANPVVWGPPLNRFTMSSFADVDRRDPRLVSYSIVQPTEAQLADYKYSQNWSWSPVADSGNLTIDLGVPRTVVGIITLGGAGDPLWRFFDGPYVKSYNLKYANSTANLSVASPMLVNASVDSSTQAVKSLDNVVARYFQLIVVTYVSHVYLRADVLVRPEPFFMIKDASLGVNCNSVNIGSHLNALIAACQGKKYSCPFFVNSSLALGTANCLRDASLVVEWFYNGILQSSRVILHAANTTITLVPDAPAVKTCQPDTTWAGQGVRCGNMNECGRKCTPGQVPGRDECNDCDESTSVCEDTEGSFNCKCLPGYKVGTGNLCINVNECEHECVAVVPKGGLGVCHNCDSVSTSCVDAIGSFSCVCNAGFAPVPGSNTTCDPVNECLISCATAPDEHCNRCFVPESCVNTNTTVGFTCTCPPGYSGNGIICTDVNECMSTADCPLGSDCINTPGSYTCNCSAGYISNNGQCEDQDECINPNICGGTCLNTPGSYLCPPFISNVRWLLQPTEVWVQGPVNLTSVTQTSPDVVEITVTNPGNFYLASDGFAYGSVEYPSDFATEACLEMPRGTFNCNMAPGAGRNLHFLVSYCYNSKTCGEWQTPLFPFSYPAPTLMNNSLRTPETTGTTHLILTSQFGANVLMDGSNFLPVATGELSAQLSITFGSSPVHKCVLQQSTDSMLQCHMSAFADTNLTFQVIAGRGSSAQVIQGTDQVSVILASSNLSCSDFPAIINVSGCVSSGSSAAQCPTQGGVPISITSDVVLVPPVVVLVGNRQCPIVEVNNNNTVTCTLPRGVGKNVAVTLGHATPTAFSLAFFLVSYAPPSISSISSSSCTSLNNVTLVECATSGRISITGNNFGDSGAMVLIGGEYIAAIHDDTFSGPSVHQHLLVPFPAQKQGTLELLVFAQSGAGTPPGTGPLVTFAFALCPAGNMTDVNGTCFACPPGFVTNSSGQRWCSSCDAGYFQPNSGKSFCIPCSSGRFSTVSAETCTECSAGTSAGNSASICTTCSPGTFSGPGASDCTACIPGTFQSLAGMSFCPPCPIGSFAGNSSQTTCRLCLPGSRAAKIGLAECDLCPLGRFQIDAGTSQCMACGPGTYSNASGALMCRPCSPGSASSANASESCALCSPGFYQDQCGMQTCTMCAPGTYASTSGHVQCAPCQPGRFTNISQQLECQECVPGRFQSNAGGVLCDNCTAGDFSGYGALLCQKCKAGKTAAVGQFGCVACTVGKFRERDDSAPGCVDCSSGWYQTAEGQARCKECPAGWYTNTTTSCYQCSRGTYSTGFSSSCLECAAGYYARPFEGESQCFACIPGRFSNQSASTSCIQCSPGSFLEAAVGQGCTPCDVGKFSSTLSTSCDKCAAGRYSAGASLDDCLSCPPGATVNKEQTQCHCRAGQYGITTIKAGITTFECLDNPVGTETDQAGILQSDLVTLPGYWRRNNASLTYYRCFAPQFCLGGKESTCGNFREGPVCALCQPGYKSASTSRECVACPAVAGTSWGITFGILVAVGVALIFAYWLILKMADTQQQELLAKFKLKQEVTVANMMEATKVGDEYFSQLREEIRADMKNKATSTEDEVVQCDDDSVAESVDEFSKKTDEELVTYGQRRAPNFMYKIKIVVGFYQIASLLPSQGGIIWPRQFVDFINFFSFLNFDFIPWHNLACAVSLNYYTKILIVGLLPIGMICALGAFFSCSLVFYGRTDDLGTQMTKQNQILKAKRQFTKLVLFTIFLLYPFVSRTTLGVYNCVEIEGVQYLATDFTLLCGAPEWNVAAGYTAIFVALYPLGTPVIYYFLMSRTDRRTPEAFLELGFLYEAYVDDCWYWELLDMGHKLILTSIVVFMPNELIMGANMVIMVLYLILLLVCNPYLRKGDDRLHLLAQTNLFVLALMGHALRLLDDPFKAPFASRFTVEALLSALLISINVLFLTSFLIIAGRNIKKAYVQYVFRRKKLLAANSVEDPSQSWVRFSPPVASQSMAEG